MTRDKTIFAIGRPQESEAAPYYFTYINQVQGEDPLPALESQLQECLTLFSTISEEKSLHRYAPDKWDIRQVLNHVSDTERVTAFRALWFARGFESALPSYDQHVAVSGAGADRMSWEAHVEEFRRVRLATISLFRTCRPSPGTRVALPATTISLCARLLTSSWAIATTMWLYCTNDTCSSIRIAASCTAAVKVGVGAFGNLLG